MENSRTAYGLLATALFIACAQAGAQEITRAGSHASAAGPHIAMSMHEGLTAAQLRQVTDVLAERGHAGAARHTQVALHQVLSKR